MRSASATISGCICAIDRFPVEMVNVGMPCESKPHMGENDPARRFVNLKACFYQTLADAFERDQVDGLDGRGDHRAARRHPV